MPLFLNASLSGICPQTNKLIINQFGGFSQKSELRVEGSHSYSTFDSSIPFSPLALFMRTTHCLHVDGYWPDNPQMALT